MVAVAATGNGGSSSLTYPSGMSNVIGVAATDQNDALAASSNTGSAAVAAPGVSIHTTQASGTYGEMSGTSAASAHVAGLAALLAASGKTNSEASSQIRGATDPVAGQSFGRINVAKALGAPVLALATPTAGPTPTPGATPVYEMAAADNTNTNISCSPSSIALNASTTCTATVTNTSDANSSPLGSVSFALHASSSAGASGSFTPSASCTLTPSSGAPSTCQVSYTPTNGTGTHVIEGVYASSNTSNWKNSQHKPGFSLGVTGAVTVTIAATDASAAEPSDTGTFTVTRTGSTSSALVVSYTVGGTATSGSDYTAMSGSVTIPAGSTTATITVAPADDSVDESSETVIVTLSSSASYTIGASGSATVTIADNDPPEVVWRRQTRPRQKRVRQRAPSR